jgi:amidohydrolase
MVAQIQTQTQIEAVKVKIAEEAAALHPRLIEISHTLHANPEVLFQEHQSAALLAGILEGDGFAVQRGVAGLETAFVARHGSGRPVVALLAEYDALPKLGHACGHNLIAAWAVGAGLALRRSAPEGAGTIMVIGTPAEEGGGGKVTMAKQGVFRGLDAAIMMHPRDATFLDRGSLAVSPYVIEFFGKSSHASARPEAGINALDAVLQVFFSVNAMRQSLKLHTKIHGVITHGGDAPNVIPDYAAAKFLVRAKEQAYLEEIKQRFLKIVDAAAAATGATPKVTEGISYEQRVSNRALVETFRDNLTRLGYAYEVPPADEGVGSSDIGNVSQQVPAIHPYLQICDRGIGGHTPGFAAAARSTRADELLRDGAILLAWTGADVLFNASVRERIRASFREQLGRDPLE